MKTFFYLSICMLCMMLYSCKSSVSMGAFTEFETYCVNTEMDGSLTLRSWGEGKNKKDAIEQAKKVAVSDVIFKGINKGLDGYMSKPLMPGANARENNQDYFNKFFADGGEYARYVNFKDERNVSRQKMQNSMVYKYGVTVTVMRAQLKEKLKNDGLIK